MKKFSIKRSRPGAADLSPEELQAISQTSREVVNQVNRPYCWKQYLKAVVGQQPAIR